MALARYEGVAQDSAGNVIPNATVEVRRDQAGRPVVPLFSDRNGTAPMGNPITTNERGQFAFHVPGGVYYIRVFTGPSQAPFQEYTRRYQAVGTAAERDVEELASSLNSGMGIFGTFDGLELFTPEATNVGARVINDPDPALNGDYLYEGSAWVKQRNLPDTLARMEVTGGTPNAIEASITDGIDPAAVVMLLLTPEADNTGPVKVNGIDLLAFDGSQLEEGWLAANVPVFLFVNDDGDYQLISDVRYQIIAGQVINARLEVFAARDKAEEWAENPVDDPVETGLFSAKHHALKAAGSASASNASAVAAAESTTAAKGARDGAIAAAEASGPVVFFDTKALANAGVGALPANQIVEVIVDETRTAGRTRYRKESGALVFKIDISLKTATVKHRDQILLTEMDRRQPELRLARFKGKLADIANGVSGAIASLLLFGDSITKSLIPDNVLLDLYRHYGFRGQWGGPGTNDIGSPTYSLNNLTGGTSSGATVVTDQWALSPNGSVFQLSAAGHRVSSRLSNSLSQNAINRVTIVYERRPGGGSFKLQTIRPNGGTEYPIDGATINTDGAAGLVAVAVDLPAREAGTALSAVWVSGSCAIVGFLSEDTTARGLLYASIDRGGIDMVNTNTMPVANLAVILNLLAPDLIAWSMKDGVNSAMVSPKLLAHQTLWDAAYATEWLYIAPYPDATSGTVTAARAQADPVITHAVGYGHDYWDPLVDCPTYAFGLAEGYFMDATHLGPKGQAVLGPRLWKATGLLPAQRAGSFSSEVRQSSAVLETLSVSGRDFTTALRQLREAGVRSALRGLKLPASANAYVASEAAVTPPGSGSFTMMALLKVPAGAPATLQPFGLRTGLSGGNQAGAINLDFRGAGFLDARVGVRTLDNTVTATYTATDAGAAFWARAGEVVHVALRRDAAAPAGVAPICLFINGVKFAPTGQAAGTPLQEISAALFKIGAVTADIGANDLEYFGAAYYTSALDDAAIIAASLLGTMPAGEVVWTLGEGSGRIASSRNNLGIITNNAEWLYPALPKGRTDANSTGTLIANERVIAARTSAGRFIGTLPAAPKRDDFVEIQGQGSSGWQVAQLAGHQIVEGAGATVGTNATTAGVGGTLSSAGRYDSVRLRCVVADAVTPSYVWAVERRQGTLAFA